ncbi:MAG TPA: TonB-dependent receptor [Kofleriaceae bacterium]|nr:TonB-dependent receptor [Kofleriaceae bacterium]
MKKARVGHPVTYALLALCWLWLQLRVAYAGREVSGVVVDQGNATPVAHAMVTIGGIEATTNSDGEFTVHNVPAGLLDLLVLADDYQPYFSQTRAGAIVTVKLNAEGGGEIITVRAQAPREPNTHAVSVEQIRSLPGSGNDVLRVLQSLPGVARTPLGLGGLALRGTAPRDSRVFLDDIEVPLLYHFGGISSFVPSSAIADLTVEPSGFGVRYGRGIGGVANVTARNGRGDRWRAGGEVSLLHAAAIAEGPGPMRGSWLVAARRSYIDAVLAAAPLDFTLLPRYMDGQLRWQSGDGRITAMVFGSDDKLKLERDPTAGGTAGIDAADVKSFDYASRFVRAALRYQVRTKSLSLTVQPSIGLDHVAAQANHKGIDKGMARDTLPLALRASAQGPWLGGNIAGGFDGKISRYSYDLTNTPPAGPDGNVPDIVIRRTGRQWATDSALWLEGNWTTHNGTVGVRPGVRGEYLQLANAWFVDPRLALTEDANSNVRFTQTLGLYHQAPSVVDLDPIFGKRKLQAASSIQATAGVKINLAAGIDVSSTVYYQHMRQLTADVVTGATAISANGSSQAGGLLSVSREVIDDQFGSYTYRESIGRGYAYGVELMARKQVGAWVGWFAYTYGRSFRRGDPLTQLSYTPYVLDQPHVATVVASYTLNSKWKFGGRLRAASGNPYTPVVGAYPKPGSNGMEYYALDGPTLSQRLPAFFQLDLRIDRSWPRRWGSINLFLDVQNASYRANPEGISYSVDYMTKYYSYGIPIFPSLGVEIIPK